MRVVSLFLLAGVAACGQEFRAFWADGFHDGYKTQAQVEQLLADVRTARANAVFIQVRLRANSYYLNSLEPPAEDAAWSPSFDALAYLIERAHQQNVQVHAWFTMTPLWFSSAPPRDPKHLWHRHGPETTGSDNWMTWTRDGRQNRNYLDPGHPGVPKYLAEVVLHVAKNYDVDGIHLDYIRYPEPGADRQDHGYNATAVERFQRESGTLGLPALNTAWADFRRRNVTQMVRQIYLRAAEIKPGLTVSAATITWGTGPTSDAEYRARDAYASVFQDWRSWLEEGIVDLSMPMNYFVEARNAAFYDRWIDYQKNRQYRRGMLVGQGVYLNPIADSVAQLRRALAPSAAGNKGLGVAFYSYASTNTLNAAGAPVTPNAEFYQAVANVFGSDAAAPELPWKKSPSQGHLLGTLEVEGAPEWLVDGVEVLVESDTTGALARRTTVDPTGFYGAADLAPDRYRVRLVRNGQEIYRTVAQDVAAGAAVRFDVRLRLADVAFAHAEIQGVRNILGEEKSAAAPGDVLTLVGRNLAPESGAVTVLLAGRAAHLYRATPTEIDIAMPALPPGANWPLAIRHSGTESLPFTLEAVPYAPLITGVRRVDGYLEIYAIGLGDTANLRVLMSGGEPARLLYQGAVTGYPGLTQINVEIPAGLAAGRLWLVVGDGVRSNEAAF